MPVTDLTLADVLRHHERQASYCYERARHPLAKYETRMAWETEAELHLTLADVLRATIGRPVPLVGQRSTGNGRCKFAAGGACCVSHCGDPVCLGAPK